MKSKNYWDKATIDGDPFQVPKRLAKGLSDLVQKYEAAEGDPPVVKYLWVYVTEDNLQRRSKTRECGDALELDGWLNVIDEAASLGADWMVVYVGASLCQCPEIWKMCAWGQEEHDFRIGLHLSSACLSEDDVERLTQLDLEKTYLIADREILNNLRSLEDKGVQLCEANVRTEERMSPCANPAAIACVGIDGRLYTCGLVLGEEAYHLGSVLERGLREVIQDRRLPHAVPNTVVYHDHGCDGCPPHIAHRVAKSLPK